MINRPDNAEKLVQENIFLEAMNKFPHPTNRQFYFDYNRGITGLFSKIAS